MRIFKSDFDKNLYSTLKLINLLYSGVGYIIGGSTALYLQGIKLSHYPNDVDLLFNVDKSSFLDYVRKSNIRKPKTPIKCDWGFHPDLLEYSEVNLVNFYGLNLKVQSIEQVLEFKQEFLDSNYSKIKIEKHRKDLLELMKLIDEQTGQYSGLSEVAPALEGRSYGPLDEFNKTELDTEGFGIPDQVVQNFRIKQKSMNTRTFSRKTKFRVNQSDILEFNAWINSKKITPRLREFFDSDLDYENFMVDYQDKTNEKTFSEIGAVVLKNPDGTHEVVSIQGPADEDRIKNYKDREGCRVVKRCKSTSEADDYINSHNLTRAYSAPTEKVLIVETTNPDKLAEIIQAIKDHGNPGHSFDIVMDEESKKEFNWDGDGSDSIGEIKIEDNKFFSTKLFDAIPKDHPDQDLGTNSFIVVKVSPVKGDYYYYDLISELHPWFDLVSKTRPGQNVPKLIDKKFVVTPQTKAIYLKDANEYIQNMSRKLGLGLYSEGECPDSGCIQKKPNGKWGVISNKTGEFWDADYESEDKAKAALAAYHANKAFSELSDRLFADLTVNNDPSILSKKKSGSASTNVGDVVLKSEVPTITADWDRTKPFNLSVEPWIVANCINDKADGLYIGSLLGDTIDVGNSHISIDIKSSSSQPIETLVLLKNGKAFIYKRTQLESKNKTFSDGVQYDYRFSITPTELSYEMPYIIGSWMLAASVCHLYHICDQKYSGHMALDEFYTDFPEKIDALAEHYLADNEKAEFRVCVVPHECPIDYLTRLVEFTMKYSELNKDKISSPYQSQLDDIVNFTKGILYKLKRLGSGRRIFSILSNDTEG